MKDSEMSIAIVHRTYTAVRTIYEPNPPVIGNDIFD